MKLCIRSERTVILTFPYYIMPFLSCKTFKKLNMEKRNVHTQGGTIPQNKKNIAIDLFRKFISTMNRLFAVI